MEHEKAAVTTNDFDASAHFSISPVPSRRFMVVWAGRFVPSLRNVEPMIRMLKKLDAASR